MREDIANLVYPVLQYGIRLKELLASNDPPDFRTAQKTILALLQTPTGDRDFVGDGQINLGDPASMRADFFLGVRYPLVCWLDEIFIADSPWKTEWTENKLEQAIFGTNDRAWKFWDQARRAETRPGTDALEVFYLCVMLGFRGDLEGMPDKLKTWRETTESQLKKGRESEWPAPPEGRPGTFVPPLLGEKRRQKMALLAGIMLLLLIPVGVFLLFSQFNR
jgi:type VI secretion system protein ImpK